MPPKKVQTISPPTVILRKKRSSTLVSPNAAAPLVSPRPKPQSTPASGHPRTTPPKPTTVQHRAPAPRKTNAIPSAQPPTVRPDVPQPASPSWSAPGPGPLTRQQREAQAQREVLAIFRERWPQVFPEDFRRLKPLALGIHHEIARQLPAINLGLIRRTLARFQHGGSGAYWRAVRKGGARYDLAGRPCGEVTAEEQTQATHSLDAFAAQRRAKHQARHYAETTPHAADSPPRPSRVEERSL